MQLRHRPQPLPVGRLEPAPHEHEKQRDQDHPEAGDITQRDKCGAGDRGAGGKQVAFTKTLGNQAGRYLERGHCGAVRRAYHADLRQRQAESLRQQRQQHIGQI